MSTAELFDATTDRNPALVVLGPGAAILRGFAIDAGQNLLNAVERILDTASLRHLTTPGGYVMSVAMSNCGQLGWVSDRHGYRYDAIDPDSGRPWPAMPAVFRHLAAHAAQDCGYAGFTPDACLINVYEPGARLSLHQDRNERDANAPIVSVSLGLPATFLFGGPQRKDKPQRYRLEHGDVVVWGGPSRFHFHGVAPLADGYHPLLGCRRINLTFRKAG